MNIRIYRGTLEKAKRAGMMSSSDARANIDASIVLDRMVKAILEGDATSGEQTFAIVKKIFDEENAALKKLVEKTKKYINNSLEFCAAVFGPTREVAMLITELTADFSCAHFISRYGSEQYFKYNKELLINERRIELMQEIEDLDL